MGRYKKQIKVLLNPQEFYGKVAKIQNPQRRVYNILLYYLGCRGTEARNLTYENFTYDEDNHRLLVQIYRLKHSRQTPPNPLYLDSPFVQDVFDYWSNDRMGAMFLVSRQTGYNWVNKTMGWYPHYYRMNRISQFLESGYNIMDIRSWFGITVNAIDYYLVEKKLKDMGRDLK